MLSLWSSLRLLASAWLPWDCWGVGSRWGGLRDGAGADYEFGRSRPARIPRVRSSVPESKMRGYWVRLRMWRLVSCDAVLQTAGPSVAAGQSISPFGIDFHTAWAQELFQRSVIDSKLAKERRPTLAGVDCFRPEATSEPERANPQQFPSRRSLWRASRPVIGTRPTDRRPRKPLLSLSAASPVGGG